MKTIGQTTVKPIEKDGKVIGVEIPFTGKAIYFDKVAFNKNWDEALAYAKSVGEALPTKKELHIIAAFYDEIAEIWPDIRKDWIWSSEEYSTWSSEEYPAGHAWAFYTNGNLYASNKYNKFYAVPLSDLNTEDCNTENTENHQTK
ncbi:MAG: DUF1566 domain-containing protein [Bacteroidales bacterium]|nr:DUF1566 domain-containing protein [Bacteroidales bacterium]